jgi:hypothetical protein
MDSLIEKLMVSKKIMDRHNEMDKGISPKPSRSNMSESYSPSEYNEAPIPATYNIPEEFLSSAPQTPKAPPAVMTEDRIRNSKLPDAIKQLMMEHPIQQPQSYAPTLSNEVIEKAARLMGNKKEIVVESKKQQPNSTSYGISASDIKKIVRETVEEVLSENGLMVESTQKSNEVMTIKVGKHIFEGKILKIKKVQ